MMRILPGIVLLSLTAGMAYADDVRTRMMPTGQPKAAPQPAGRIATPVEALEATAKKIAASRGISLEEARRRLLVDGRAAEIMEQAIAVYAERLAGTYIEHEPRSRVVVRLTGNEPVPTQVHHAGVETFEIVFQPGASHTRAEILALMERESDTIDRMLPGWNGRYVDERTGEIVIGVEPRDAAAAAAGERLAETLGVPVRIEEEGPMILNIQSTAGEEPR